MTRNARKVASPHVVNIEDLRRLAKLRLPKGVFDYVDGGAESECTLRENCAAFAEVIFRPRGAVACTISDLSTQVYGINDCGIMIGLYGDGSTAHGFYGRPGSLHSFDLPGAGATIAQGINNEGRVVGRYAKADGLEHAFVTGRIAGASCL